MNASTKKEHCLGVYAKLSQIPHLGYRGKILLITFLGIHVPLITLCVYISFSANMNLSETWLILLIALIATLAGTAASLLALHHLLRPIMLAGQAMQDYISMRKPVDLPIHFEDAAGQLMADTVYTLQTLDTNMSMMTRIDSVSGLLNRKGLFKQLAANAAPTQHFIVVLVLKNWEKIVNADSKVAQQLIRETARKLKLFSPENSLIARISDDKFSIVLPYGCSREGVANVVKRLLAKMMAIEPSTATIPSLQVHVGIASCPDDANNNELALALAISAVSEEAISFFCADRHKVLLEQYNIEMDFINAIENEHFEIWYQPVVNFRTKKITSFEALCRWRHPIKGIVMPDKFIGVAEQCGFIHRLGDWVFAEICRHWAQLKIENSETPRIAVNISPIQLNRPNLAKKMLDCMRKNNLIIGDVELEITESAAMSDNQVTRENLEQLSKAGFLISIDDFGTGFSNLSRINSLAVNRLKIDRQFTHDLVNNSQNRVICQSIQALALGLGLNVTGEGIESESEATALEVLGCFEQQGYWYSRPVPFSDISQLIETIG